MANTGAIVCGTVESEAWSGNFTTTLINTSDNNCATHTGTTYAAAYISDFNFGIPAGATIDGIVVTIEASGDGTDPSIRLSLSWDNGATWTATKEQVVNAHLVDTLYDVGGSSDTWGRAWTVAEFAVGTFQMKVEGKTSSAASVGLDYLTATVYYTPGVSSFFVVF